jgi:hypothetical protein
VDDQSKVRQSAVAVNGGAVKDGSASLSNRPPAGVSNPDADDIHHRAASLDALVPRCRKSGVDKAC